MNFKRFYSLNFLAKFLLSAIFVNAIPSKITDFGSQAQYITSKGFPEPLSNLLLLAALGLLISGSILLIFSNKTKLACSLLLIFLVPTTIIFHLVPLQLFLSPLEYLPLLIYFLIRWPRFVGHFQVPLTARDTLVFPGPFLITHSFELG